MTGATVSSTDTSLERRTQKNRHVVNPFKPLSLLSLLSLSFLLLPHLLFSFFLPSFVFSYLYRPQL